MSSTDIQDYGTYNHRMEMSMIDKLFFVDKIQPDLIVDFGCADGTLIRAIRGMNPTVQLEGYDIDPNMCRNSTSEISITNNWERIYAYVQKAENPALILNSVIHEVCHYGSQVDICDFWNKVFETGFKYIVIRDMVPCRSVDRISNINDVKKIYHKFLGSKELTDFERIWGSVENNRQLIHFLLKYRYIEPNWNREVRENYMPVAREDLLAKIPLSYDVLFHEHFVLPHVWQTVKEDTGIEIKDPTHLKLILTRNCV
jgi:hypothetical protein